MQNMRGLFIFQTFLMQYKVYVHPTEELPLLVVGQTGLVLRTSRKIYLQNQCLLQGISVAVTYNQLITHILYF